MVRFKCTCTMYMYIQHEMNDFCGHVHVCLYNSQVLTHIFCFLLVKYRLPRLLEAVCILQCNQTTAGKKDTGQECKGTKCFKRNNKQMVEVYNQRRERQSITTSHYRCLLPSIFLWYMYKVSAWTASCLCAMF